MNKVLVLDTSILCVWLGVPGKETCGSDADRWDRQRVEALLEQEEEQSTTFVLPLASIIETGNHIAQAHTQRYEKAQALAQIMVAAADEQTPWSAFTRQTELWSAEHLKSLAVEWPQRAAAKLSIGDATIQAVAHYYANMGYYVEIVTGDQGLKSLQPSLPQRPRRR
jgi:hypothetical protein